MALWTDLITPAELTGYARASLEDYEVRKGSLARWLPNRQVLDIVARLVVGQRGLVDEARFRAYDAEPEIGRRLFGKRVSVELPAIGKNLPISEYQQLRTRNASDADLRNQILRDTRDAVQSVADRIERLRGTVLVTGRATIDQANFKSDDDFARSPSHTVTAGTLWSTASADALGYLATLIDLYVSDNGEQPGAILTSQRVVRAGRVESDADCPRRGRGASSDGHRRSEHGDRERAPCAAHLRPEDVRRPGHPRRPDHPPAGAY